MPMSITAEKDAELGYRIKYTKLKSRIGYCNNFQIWGHCRVNELDPSQCTHKHKCSNCNDQTHGRRDCPRDLVAQEDRNA